MGRLGLHGSFNVISTRISCDFLSVSEDDSKQIVWTIHLESIFSIGFVFDMVCEALDSFNLLISSLDYVAQFGITGQI